MKVLLLGDRKIDNYKKVLEYLGVFYDTLDNLKSYDSYDGLIIPGGIDVCPDLYGAIKDPTVIETDVEFDNRQLEAVDYFVKHKKRILGICRGQQLLNVYFKGTLIQNIVSDIEHVKTEESDSYHSVKCDEGFLKKIYGENIVINSSHHQAVLKPGEGIKVIAKAEDGIVEAIEHESLPIIAVQFHPERLSLDFKKDDCIDGIEIFKYFLNLKNEE